MRLLERESAGKESGRCCFAQTIAKVSGTIGINAASIGGFAWGDWSLTKPGYLTFDFTKWKEAVDLGDIGRLSRIVIHEFTHIFNADRDSNPKYWTEFQGLAAKQEVFSSYAGRNNLETLPEIGRWWGCVLAPVAPRRRRFHGFRRR